MKKVILFSKLLYLNVFAKPTIRTTSCKCCYNEEIDPQSILDDMNNNNNKDDKIDNIDNNDDNNDNIKNKDENKDDKENNIDNNDDNNDNIDNNGNINDDINNSKNIDNNDDNNNNGNIDSDTANLNKISYINNLSEIVGLDLKENVAKDNTNNGNIDNKYTILINEVNTVIGWSINQIKNIDKFKILKGANSYNTNSIISLTENIDNFYKDINKIIENIKNIYKIDNSRIGYLNTLSNYFYDLKNLDSLSGNYNENLNSILDKIKSNNSFRENLKKECDNILKIINDYETNIVNKFKILYNLFTGKNDISEDKDVNKLIEILNIGKNDIFNKNIKNIIKKYNTIEKNNKILFNNLQNNIVTDRITLKDAISNLDNYLKENKDIDEITKDFDYYININNIYNNSSKVLDLKTFFINNILFNSIIDNDKTINHLENNLCLFAVKNIECSNKKYKKDKINCENLYLFIYKTKKNIVCNRLFKYNNNNFYFVNSLGATKHPKAEKFYINSTSSNGISHNIELYDINLIKNIDKRYYTLENESINNRSKKNKDKTLMHTRYYSENIFKKYKRH